MELNWSDKARLTATIKLGKSFRDSDCSTDLGSVKDGLRTKTRPKTVHVDMSALEWADPLPLLSLGAVLRTVRDYGTEILVNLGSSSLADIKHRAFLKFMATQEFVSVFGDFAKLLFDGFAYSSIAQEDGDVKELIYELGRFQQPISYRNSDCIFAKLVRVNDYRDDPKNHEKLHQKVEEMVEEARHRLIDSAYGRDPLIRDRLLQKTRKILFELLSNCVDHAYPDKLHGKPVEGYAGVYARMRGELPSNHKDADVWWHLWNTERVHCPTLTAFDANPLMPWVEVFVCDVGVGLLANTHRWAAPPDMPQINEVLDDIVSRKASNPLQALSRILFTQAFSSEDRTDGRTSVTGLLHLGLMLQRDSDFARIYTGGEWAGSVYPWNPAGGRGGFENIAKQNKQTQAGYAPGTWFAFGIQPVQVAVAYQDDRWIVASEKDRDYLIETLTLPPLVSVPPNMRFEDRRSDPHCTLPKGWDTTEGMRKESVFEKTPVVVLRPPRSIQKRQVGLWLERLALVGKNAVSTGRAPCFILVDLTPFQAITYAELLGRQKLAASCEIDVYLVTEDWAVCCLSKLPADELLHPVVDKAKKLMQADRVSSDPTSAAGLLLLLRRADSRLFWQEPDASGDAYKNLPRDMFLNERVKWPSSRAKTEANSPEEELEEVRCIDGYLDLSRALVDVDRYQACHRALRRCLNLFPDFDLLASDDLVQSITFDADRGRHRPRANIQPDSPRTRRKLVVGSVRVTSNTVKRFLDRSDVPAGSREVFIFNHPDAAKFSEGIPIAVLDWVTSLPAPQNASGATPRYERIPETPYIGVGGEKAIIIPRFRLPSAGTNTLADGFYERNPQQTYEDFHKLGALKFGHWIYGNKHDLITINLGRVIELSALDNGPSYRWLMKTINDLCFQAVSIDAADRQKVGAVLVYPSHPITDQLVAMLMDGMGRHSVVENGQGREVLNIVPLKFLTNNTVSPMRASPLAYDHLGEAVKKVREEGIECRVVVLDDGTLSGKMFRELEQLIRSLGVNEIHTVALVDRGGLPIYLDYMKEFISEHHRFWRWDVPPLGHRRSCPFCAALNQVSAMQERLSAMQSISSEGAMHRRLSQWTEVWRPVSVVDHWETHGLEPTPLGGDEHTDSHRFCIYPNQPEDATHRVLHQSSTGLTAAIMEITRSTPRSYYALEKTRKIVGSYGPLVGIEIISAQLLLFFDELDYWDRLDRFQELLALMWQCKEDSDETALAGLCLTLADDDLLADLWQWLKQELICRVKVSILDARIVADLLRHRFNRLPEMENDKLSETPTDEERYNYLVMFPDMSFRHGVAQIFGIIGETHREIHNMGLSACLKEIESSISHNDYTRSVRRYNEAKQAIEDLAEALDKLNLQFCCDDDNKYSLNPEQDARNLRELRDSGVEPEKGKEDVFSNALGKWVEQTKLQILAPNNAQSLACRYRSQLVMTTNPLVAINSFLSEFVGRVCNDEWREIVQAKINNSRDVCSQWLTEGRKEPNDKTPSIEGGNTERWPNEISIYFDRYVRHCIFEMLTNCVHAPVDMVNPWKSPDLSDDKGLHATMWWKIFVDSHFMEIAIINACNKKEIILAPTEASSGLERVGGEVVTYVVEDGIVNPRMEGEASSLFVERLSALPTNQRIAATIIRIPLMKTVQER